VRRFLALLPESGYEGFIIDPHKTTPSLFIFTFYNPGKTKKGTSDECLFYKFIPADLVVRAPAVRHPAQEVHFPAGLRQFPR
jgi:hypothetical protein